jgi:hypothetical protein
MAKAEAYKVKKDISLTRAIREIGERVDGSKLYEQRGVNYPVGSFVLSKNISPPLRERVENGELDDFLEPADGDEAKAAISLGELGSYFGTYIPEHEVESYLLREYGHTTVPRDQVLELKSAGAEAAAEALEASREGEPSDEDNPLPKNAEVVPALADVSRGDYEAVVPENSEHVDVPAGIEQPPGLPVGDTLAAAEGGGPAKKRGRPRKSAQQAEEKK